MRVHFLYQIFILIKLFDIWERLQGTLFLQFVRSHSVFQEIFSFYFLKLVIFPYFWHNRYMKLTIQRMARIAILSALAVGLRSVFIGLPNIQPITAMFFVPRGGGGRPVRWRGTVQSTALYNPARQTPPSLSGWG